MGRRAAPAFIWGLLCGFALGAWHTHLKAVTLLSKNHALEAAGLIALPGGRAVAEAIGASGAIAGGVFFALSFGLGLGALFFLWGSFARLLPKIALGIAAAPVAVPALIALWHGEVATALACAAIALVAFPLGAGGVGKPDIGGGMRFLLVALLIAAGLAPWFSGSGSLPIKLRDKVLFESQTGRALVDYYYDWTLYPAEAIKPLAALTQPTAFISPEVPIKLRDEFCRSALDFRILCTDQSAEAADFTLSLGDEDQLTISRGETAMAWSLGKPGAKFLWQEFSDVTDDARELRRFTAFGLLKGLPLAFIIFLAVIVEAGCALLFRQRARKLTPLAAVALSGALIAGALGGAEVPTRERLASGEADNAEIAEALASLSTSTKLYGIRAAAQKKRRFAPEITALMADPVVNVRYTAALSAGRLTDPQSREKLLETVSGNDAWYVKDRAYYALWRRGWRPR